MEELPKAYDPKLTDVKWSQFWEENGFFKVDPTSDKPAYSIVIPPPNVTGVLHMGHALVNTLQDILIRWKRMSGYEALWMPGTDHAGIATQTVVERHLMQSEGKRRSDYDREVFLKHIWDWKEKSETTILKQLKSLGCSCDWSRLRFTLDDGCSLAVRTMFKKLFDEGLIYRGDYLVNWDPVTQTALADDEVEYEERESYLWYFKYHLVDGSGYVHIATTRPETLLGDTAIAVSPKDERYKHLINKKVRVPFVDREIPIIADPYVDPEFGTGMVKITPAHDPNDYKIGLNHNLPMINVMTTDGRMNENAGPFHEMSREEAREAVVHQMKELGLLDKTERYSLRVGISYRSKAIIEPLLSKQWFVKMESFKEKLRAAVNDERVKILPPSWKQTYFHWIDNLRDWCISRQLWWGHRIPVWYNKEDPTQMRCSTEEIDDEMWEQDPDVLDTWFSSALWPFSTMGWPNKTPELKKFYPNSVLVTGHDILFFWVARMIAMGEHALDKVPFPETFLHGLIYGRSYWRNNSDGSITYVAGEEKKQYDLGKQPPKEVHSKWEKLSKSKGNVIDPLELIDEYGTDAVRMSLCACANQSPQIDLDRRRFDEFKNFANKVWNGARFVFMNLSDLTDSELDQNFELALEDKWILSAMGRVNRQVNESLSNYHFDQAAQLSYDFFWKEFCAYYVEFSKPILFGDDKTARKNKQKILATVLSNSIRLLHPMAPFITEELYQLLKKQFPSLLPEPACIVAPYPQALPEDEAIHEQFAHIEKVIYTIRNIRGEMKIPPHIATDVYLIGNFPQEQTRLIGALVKTTQIICTDKAPEFPLSATGVVGELTILIPLPQELADKEKQRLEKEREKLENSLARLKQLLDNQDFLAKAAPELIEKKKSELSSTQNELNSLNAKLVVNKYTFKPYNAQYPHLFAVEKSRLTEHIQADIQHVGSTAVPNLGGKGIIDIAIATESIEETSKQLEMLGYEFHKNGSTAERLFFRKGHEYHIHLMHPNSQELKDLIIFRDLLKADLEVMQQYAEIKKRANGNKTLYRELKKQLIEPTLSFWRRKAP